jgi:hypothetical protein
MSDENNITSGNLASSKPLDAVQPATSAGQSSERVMVKPLKSFLGDEGHKTPDSEPYEVTRSRAAELKSNGLVEYVDEKDEADADETKAKEAADRVRKDAESRRGKRG